MCPTDEEPSQSQARLHESLRRNFGPLVLGALNDAKTTDLLLNPDGKIWQGRLGERMRHIGNMGAGQSEMALRTLASALDTVITPEKPWIEGVFPLDGSRIAGQIPPIVAAPTFAIRKRALAVFTLGQYVEAGIMARDHLAAIADAVTAHKNILVVGGTGSGKTTLANAIIQAMVEADPHERLFIIEDTGEIQCRAANSVSYVATLDFSVTRAVRTTMRMNPDRIIVGEVRGPEALDLLLAWNSGHSGGVATLHADHARSGLAKLGLYVSQHPHAPKPLEPLIGEAVHVVVHIAMTPEGRRVKEVIAVTGYQDGQYQIAQPH
jgi:P-type conjugative transfer ATPase TrbB